MGNTGQKYIRWRNLPYGLSLLGLLVILLSGVNFWQQQRQESLVAGASIQSSRQPSGTSGQGTSRPQNRWLTMPEASGDYLLMGTAYLQKARETGDPNYYYQAEATLHQALDAAGDPAWLRARAMTGIGAAKLGRHEFKEALEWAQQSLEIDPTYASTYGVLGDAQMEVGEYDAAARSFQSMVDLKPDLGSYARAARLRQLEGDTAGAIEAQKMAAAAGGSKTEASAWARVQLGNLYFNSGQIEEAVEEYETGLWEFNGYYPALFSLGKARAAQGDYDAAIGFLERSVAVIPQPAALAFLGDLYALSGERDKAQLQYDTVEFIARLAVVNQQVYNRELALFYADHDLNLEAAVELSEQELEVRKDIYGYDALAWSLFKNGSLDEAAVAIDQAMQLGTQDASIFFHAGMIYHGLGDLPQSRLYLEKALDLNPGFSILHSRRASDLLEEINGRLGPSGNGAVEVGSWY